MKTMSVNKTPAVVRMTPHSCGGVLRTLRLGTHLEIVEQHSGWAQLVSGGWLSLTKLTQAGAKRTMNGTPETETPDLELVAN
jgi:hypothetical protein